MGSIILSCGHEEPTKPLGWELHMKDYDGWGDVGLIYASYCVDCFAKRLKEHPDTTFLSFDEAWEACFGQKD